MIAIMAIVPIQYNYEKSWSNPTTHWESCVLAILHSPVNFTHHLYYRSKESSPATFTGAIPAIVHALFTKEYHSCCYPVKCRLLYLAALVQDEWRIRHHTETIPAGEAFLFGCSHAYCTGQHMHYCIVCQLENSGTVNRPNGHFYPVADLPGYGCVYYTTNTHPAIVQR